jgi:hypothetical protein
MIKIDNNQSNSLYSIECVQDISHESAAAISGGIAVYTDSNYAGQERTAKGVPDLRVSDRQENVLFNNQISSIINDTDKRWAFYTRAGYSGDRFTLEPGESAKDLFGTGFNDKITSYRSEASGSAQPL